MSQYKTSDFANRDDHSFRVKALLSSSNLFYKSARKIPCLTRNDRENIVTKLVSFMLPQQPFKSTSTHNFGQNYFQTEIVVHMIFVIDMFTKSMLFYIIEKSFMTEMPTMIYLEI